MGPSPPLHSRSHLEDTFTVHTFPPSHLELLQLQVLRQPLCVNLGEKLVLSWEADRQGGVGLSRKPHRRVPPHHESHHSQMCTYHPLLVTRIRILAPPQSCCSCCLPKPPPPCMHPAENTSTDLALPPQFAPGLHAPPHSCRSCCRSLLSAFLAASRARLAASRSSRTRSSAACCAWRTVAASAAMRAAPASRPALLAASLASFSALRRSLHATTHGQSKPFFSHCIIGPVKPSFPATNLLPR